MNMQKILPPDKENLVRAYLLHKNKLAHLKERYLEMFEYRYGIDMDELHSLKECGEKFGVSHTRVRQVVARVEYEVEKIMQT